MAMQKLLPQKAEGEYYVSYNGLDKDIKAMTYKHQNWYTKKVKMIQMSGFNTIITRLGWHSNGLSMSSCMSNQLVRQQFLLTLKMVGTRREEPRSWCYLNMSWQLEKPMMSFAH